MTVQLFTSGQARIRPQVAAFTALRAGAWLTITGAVAGLVIAFWLRRQPGSPERPADA
jgi:uncharacterized membrane protein YdjX (TVP38/TMEM64 family)